MSEAEIDWKFWEKKYGRVLSESERLEIKTNVLGFMHLLIEEDKKQREAKAEVR